MIKKINETYYLNNVKPSLSNVILAREEGMTDFYIEQDFWSSSTMKRSAKSNKINVKTENISKIIKKINPSLLIMDIEGGEKELISTTDFYNIKKFIIEIHPHVIGEKNASIVIKDILSKGFVIKFNDSKNSIFIFEKFWCY